MLGTLPKCVFSMPLHLSGTCTFIMHLQTFFHHTVQLKQYICLCPCTLQCAVQQIFQFFSMGMFFFCHGYGSDAKTLSMTKKIPLKRTGRFAHAAEYVPPCNVMVW